MYDSEELISCSTLPLVRLRFSGAKNLPLQKDWSKRWCAVPQRFRDDFVQRIREFDTRHDDVYLVSYLKTGSTWLQELAWLLLNQLDFELAKSSYAWQRSHYLEHSTVSQRDFDSVAQCEQMASPRLIKSHLPAHLLPSQVWQHGRRIIYVARNPKDVLVSSYHFFTGVGLWRGDMATFIEEFIADKLLFTSYLQHLIEFWHMRHESNIFFVTYEEMQRDLGQVINKLANFLEVGNLSAAQINQLLQHLSFKQMKVTKYSNLTGLFKDATKTSEDFEFMRRGIIGAYKDELTAEQRLDLDQWIANFLQQYNLKESDIFGQI
ncbi:maker495 [Drosophila busckii]|uniref:Maker495 n=1 Tax=Drosophila busckii TaxID=30019 RepID=A0A0M3QTU7_DROBS|nr:maker495 [Drosophila busckii]